MALIAQHLSSTHHRMLLNGLLNQRQSLNEFRKLTGLNKSDLEVMAFEFNKGLFNAYEVQKHFSMMNVQQCQRTIRKLVSLRLAEEMSHGNSKRPNVFALTKHGDNILAQYIDVWSTL